MVRAALVAATAGLALTLVVPSHATAAPSTEYVVKDGDFLIGIARKLGTTLDALLAANGLTISSVVHPGDTLAVPAGATAAVAPSNGSAPASGATYTVKAGDSLYVIARRLGTPLADLLAANGLTIDSVVHPGRQLAVPASATTPDAGAPAPGASAAGTTSSYTVRSGDYLFGIAKAHGIALATLLQLNDMTVTSVLHPGMTLKLPAGAVAATAAPAQSGAEQAALAASPAEVKIDAVIAFARAQIGKPYRFNAAGPDAFDCSGLTAAAYGQVGLWLPHQSAMQSTRGVAVDWHTQDIQAGDLIFMFTKDKPTVISHVGLAINSWQWIHAPRPGDVVRIGLIPSDGVIQAVRRYVTG